MMRNLASAASSHLLANRSQALAGLIVFALLLRVIFLILAGVNAPLTGDEPAYQQLAEHFAAGQGLYQNNNPFFPGQVLYAWQAPLYPLALGVLYSFFGSNPLIGKLFGILVSATTVYVMYDLVMRVARSALVLNEPDDISAHQIAFVAAFLVAIYPGFLTNAHLLLSETLFIFLLLLSFAWVARALEGSGTRVWLWAAGAGAAWGLSALTRGLTLYFTPLFATWIVWMVWRKRTADSGQQRAQSVKAIIQRAAVAGLLFVLGTVIVIAPWTLRNYAQFGQVVLLETKGGVNLWLGNSPYTPYEFIRNVWKVGVREPMLDGLPQGELERDHAAYTLALNYMRGNPLAFLERIPSKFADFWGFERNLVDIADATTRGTGWNSLSKVGADALAMIVYIFVMVAGIAGLILAPDGTLPQNARAWKILLGGFVLYFMSIHLVVFGDGRFHLPVIPFLILYAAWLVVMWRRVPYSLSRIGLALVCIILLGTVWAREMWVALRVLGG